MRIGIDADLLETVGFRPRQRIKFDDRFQLFTKKRKPPSAVFKVGGPDLDTVTAHAEGAALKRLIVAFEGLRDQFAQNLPLIIAFPDRQILGHRRIGFDRADAVDARHRGDDNHIIAFQKRPRGRVAHAVDLFVDLRFLFDKGIGARNIGFGLIVIIVRHEIFDSIVGKEILELAIKLRRKGFVRRQNDRRALGLLDDFCHRKSFASARGPQQNLIMLACQNALGQFGNRGWLIACRGKGGLQHKAFATLQFRAGQHFGARGQGIAVVMGHGDSLQPLIYSVFVHGEGRRVASSSILRKSKEIMINFTETPFQKRNLELFLRQSGGSLIGQAASTAAG